MYKALALFALRALRTRLRLSAKDSVLWDEFVALLKLIA